MLEKGEQLQLTLEEYVQTLEKQGVSPSALADCWGLLHSFDYKNQESLFSRGLYTFIYTSFSEKAAAELKELPCGSVSSQLAAAMVLSIPSGNKNFDDLVISIGLRNGAAPEVASLAVQPSHLKLAFEVVSRIDAPSHQRIAIASKCVSVLSHPDPMLVVSSLRCLLAIGEYSLLTFSILSTLFHSKNQTLRYSSYVAAAALAHSGIKPPLTIVDDLLVLFETEPIISTFLICSAKHPEVAQYLLSELSYGTSIPTEDFLRILIQASKHVQLRNDISVAIARLQSSDIKPSLQPVLAKLSSLNTRQRASTTRVVLNRGSSSTSSK